MSFKHHLIMFKEYLKINVATAMEYRANFTIQVTAMIVNDCFWVLFWWLFFSKFPIVNGWVLRDVILLYAILNLSWGLGSFFFGNRLKLAQIIAEGKLDFYLNLPKSELFHVLIGKSSWFAIGDIIFGLVLAAITLHLEQWPLFLICTLLSIIIFIAFSIIVGSLSFFIGNAQDSSHQLNMVIISFGTYPLPIFNDVARFILLTIIPAGFVSSIPVQLLKSFDPLWFALLIVAAVVFMVLAIIIFKIGLRRYESGSMIQLRV